MNSSQVSIARLMAIVAIVAGDIAAAAAILPRIPNPGVVAMLLFLEVGLFYWVRPGTPTRPFWIGFAAFGWSYVLACLAFDRAIWRLLRPFVETHILGAKPGTPNELWLCILYAGCLQLGLSVAVAVLGGLMANQIASIRGRAHLAGVDSGPGDLSPGSSIDGDIYKKAVFS
jgi:hypothetical protein